MSEVQRKTVPAEMSGLRLDQVLARLYPDFSRSRLQAWLRQGCITVAGDSLPGKTRLLGGEELWIHLDFESLNDEQEVEAEPVALEVIHEDQSIIVINKPAGLIMHPGAGNRSGTVQNGLLHRYPELSQVPRAGIVHRLDKDTTGLFVVARTLRAHKSLVEQLQTHQVARHYTAICLGRLISGGSIDKAIGRHPVDRKRMSVRENGKPAITHYRVMERFRAHTLISVSLETGRTHQIRVHMADQGHPLLGDPVYGGKPRFPAEAKEELRAAIRHFKRQALHATRLTLCHPGSLQQQSWEVAIPDDILAMLDLLRDDDAQHHD